MLFCLRNVLAFSLVFSTAIAEEIEECRDADCGVNMQLLQQEVNFKALHESVPLDEDPAAELNMSNQQSLINAMMEAEMGVEPQTPNPKLVSYSSHATVCSTVMNWGEKRNSEWCGYYKKNPQFRKPATWPNIHTWHCIDTVFTPDCESGLAKFVSVQGGPPESDKSGVWVDGCLYEHYAQYECMDVIMEDLTKEENYTYLRKIERQLTDMVHAQAIVISRTADEYLAAQLVDGSTDAAIDTLADDLDDAETVEDLTGGAHGGLAYAILLKKKELDALQKAYDEANETVQLVKPKYVAAEAAYQAALGPGPYIEENAEDAQAEYAEAQAALDAADSARKAADLAVANQTLQLQKEVGKLNDKNDELRDVQAELGRPVPPIN